MRDIKFRAWCLDSKWMEDHFFIQSNGIAHDVPSKTYDTPNTEIEENPNLVIMQFTGLQDKNGVDIYEKCEIDNRFYVDNLGCDYVLIDISCGDIIRLSDYFKGARGNVEVTKEYTSL